MVGAVTGSEAKAEQRPPPKLDKRTEGRRSLLEDGAGPLLGGERPRPGRRQSEGRGIPAVLAGECGWQIDPASLAQVHNRQPTDALALPLGPSPPA